MTKEKDGYKLTLSGAGLKLDREVSETVAQQVVAIVMGGTASVGGGAFSPAGSVTPVAGSGPQAGTPKAFVTSKRPVTDIERVACLAWYLTYVRNAPSFKTKELTELNREAAQFNLSNASATARNAVADGFLAPAGGGAKQITARGEALVDALPDREKVKAALEQLPKKKRKPSAKKVKKK